MVSITPSIPTLLIVITITFVLTRMIPGKSACSTRSSVGLCLYIAEIKLGLSSKLEQYADYMIGIFCMEILVHLMSIIVRLQA